MKVRDILPSYPLKYIEVRTYDPYGMDILFGWVHWTGKTLVSADGDYYSLNEEVKKWEYDEDTRHFTYWIHSEWT